VGERVAEDEHEMVEAHLANRGNVVVRKRLAQVDAGDLGARSSRLPAGCRSSQDIAPGQAVTVPYCLVPKILREGEL